MQIFKGQILRRDNSLYKKFFFSFVISLYFFVLYFWFFLVCLFLIIYLFSFVLFYIHFFNVMQRKGVVAKVFS